MNLLVDYIEDIENPDYDLFRLYNKYIVAGEVWYFKEKFNDKWFEKYNLFKLFVSEKLGVHYNDIAIVGSAKLGFSINPKKDYKPFDDDSDIDLLIISQALFYRFWQAYLEDSYSLVRIKNYQYVCQCIFRKFVTFNGFDKNNKFYCEWKKKTGGFEKDLQLRFDIEQDIHYRIFESWESAQMYYISGMLKNRKNLEVEQDGNNRYDKK